jgi:hypothetical protein
MMPPRELCSCCFDACFLPLASRFSNPASNCAEFTRGGQFMIGRFRLLSNHFLPVPCLGQPLTLDMVSIWKERKKEKEKEKGKEWKGNLPRAPGADANTQPPTPPRPWDTLRTSFHSYSTGHMLH